jgi:hypothetical protein
VLAVVSVAAVGSASTIGQVDLIGDGGSFSTKQFIATAITSTGPLGDLTLGAPQGVPADITAPSIIGSISVPNGPIAGIIQTTTGDFGRLLTDATGRVVATTVTAGAGGLTGQLVSRANLVSLINLGVAASGVIAAQGDIGAILLDANGQAVQDASGRLTRFGGVQVNGGLGGLIVARGNIFGDISANGVPSGRIAAHGRAEYGLLAPRVGILGNLNINGNLDSGAAIASGGVIGDAAGGTVLNVQNVKGILAAEAPSPINFGSVGNLQAASIFTGPSAAAVEAIFTDGAGNLINFDLDAGSLQLDGLAQILAQLRGLKVINGQLRVVPTS